MSAPRLTMVFSSFFIMANTSPSTSSTDMALILSETTVAKYPCADYTLYREIEAGPAGRIPLDAALLASLGDTYAIEVNYSGNPDPPVAALQKWLVCAGSISGGKAGDLNADGVIDILDLALLKAKVFA